MVTILRGTKPSVGKHGTLKNSNKIKATKRNETDNRKGFLSMHI